MERFKPQPKPDRTPPKPKRPIRKVSEKKQKAITEGSLVKSGVTFLTAEQFRELKSSSVKKKGKLRIEGKPLKKEDFGAWEMFSKMVRISHADSNGYCKCFTCPHYAPWKSFDCGHGIPRQHKATKYLLMNNKPQCGDCNGFNEGMQAEFAKQVDKVHGPGSWDSLVLLSKRPVKRVRYEFELMRDHYKAEFERIKKEKGL